MRTDRRMETYMSEVRLSGLGLTWGKGQSRLLSTPFFRRRRYASVKVRIQTYQGKLGDLFGDPTPPARALHRPRRLLAFSPIPPSGRQSLQEQEQQRQRQKQWQQN